MELIKQIDCAEAIYEALRTPMLKGTFTDTMSLAVSLVKEVPTIEAEPIKHGRWLPSDKGDCTYTCSECGFVRDAYILEEKAYCPRCGADMRERREDG